MERMASGRLVLYGMVLLLIESASCKQQYALNVPRVLLPLAASGIRSNFTVTATQGCFSWTSTKPDVASVEAVMEQNGKRSCSKKAVVTAQSSQLMRLSSVIVAEEVGGGIVLRCDVFVDTISRIEITTRTRELLLEEEPERFELQALDDEGNTFSTLNGHVVEWQLLVDEEAVHQKEPGAILNFIPFEESTYSTDPAIRRLEAEGLQGETVLVAGISTGSVKVQASLTEKIWKDVRPSLVKLLVIENIMLVPSIDVYILPLSFIHYRIQRRKQGRTEVVPLPSSQYSLHLSNSTVAQLDPKTSRVLGLVLGFTEVILEDHNMITMPTATKPTAGVHVVAPHHLGYTISPDNVWVLETGREYVIQVHIFDKNNHKIYPTENIPLVTTLPLEHLKMHYSTPNGTYHYVTAVKEGHTSIHSVLTYLRHPDTDKKQELPASISKKQQLEIYSPITVHPPRLVLLWVEEKVELHYKYLLKATGGSGTYIWSCDPEGVVGVGVNGTLEVLEQGVTMVFAADVRNTAHYNQSEVHVIPPAKMTFLPSPVEAVVGSSLSLPLQVMGYIRGEIPPTEPHPFPDCRHLRVKLILSDSSIFNVSNDRGQVEDFPEGACLILTATAIAPGHARVVVSYDGGEFPMEAVVTIAAYKPLVPIDPEVIAVVTLGASKLFVFEGGPAPWILDRSRFYKNMTAELPDNVDLQPWSTGRVGLVQHVYFVTCLKLGEQTLTIVVGNGPTLKNLYPAQAEASSRFACSLPVTMTLHPVLSHMPDCPLFSRDSNQALQFPVLCDSTLELEVEVFDGKGRSFDNFTSLLFHWDSSDHDLLPLSYPNIHLFYPTLHHHGNKATLTVTLGHQSGSVVVMVTCDRHDHMVYDSYIFRSVDPFSPTVRLTTSLLLRHKPHVDPSFLLLYDHPSNKASLSIQHGSGYFSVAHVPPGLPHPPAHVNYSSKSHEIILVPSHEGRMKLAVQDLCLEVGRPEWVGVVVGGIYYLEVMVGDKVQLGSSLVACVQVMDSEREPFPRDQLRYMNLQACPKTFHITVHPIHSDQAPLEGSWPPNSVCYKVEGVAVGTAYLAFNTTTVEGRVISSPPKEIQVFDPLNLQPDNITLLPTATFQIQSSGGPKPQVSVLYSVLNATVASVSDSGLILASEPGTTIVTGRVQYSDPSLGDRSIAYSEDTVIVMVVRLTGIKIHLPTTRLLSGVTVAVYAVGLNNESPFTFVSAIPGLVFMWSVSNMDALSVMSVYDKSGVSIQEERDFDAVLHTRNPGQGAVRLGVKCPPGVCIPDQASFTDQVRVQVLAPLRLLRPLDGHFLLPHNGRAKVVTNRDGVSTLTYLVLNGYSGVKGDNGENVIALGRNGEVKATTVNGHAVVKVTESGEEFGLNQTLIVQVEVRPISSLSISPLSIAQATPNSVSHAFPLGYSAVFIAHLHDNIGRKFDFAEVPLSHQLNHYDTVLVTPESGNSTYIVKATKQGDVVLKVWATSLPHITDYSRIRVAYAIIPSLGVVHLGATVCFTTHLLENQLGKWDVGEGLVMDVEEESGVGRALAVGRSVIYHKIDDDVVDSHTEITVAKVERIELGVDSDDIPVFTNGHRHRGLGDYVIPVKFLLATNETFTPLHFSPDKRCVGHGSSRNGAARSGAWLQQVSFECQLELSEPDGSNAIAIEYIAAEASFDMSSGMSYCKLLPSETASAGGLAVKEDMQLRLKVIAGDFSRMYFVVSEQLDIPFVPAFYIDRKEVYLSVKDVSTELIVRGLNKQLQALKVTSPYPVSVVRSSLSATSAVYKISLLPDYHSPPEQPFTNLTISFSTPLAQQEELIIVQMVEPDKFCGPPDITAPPTEPPQQPLQEVFETTAPSSFSRTSLGPFPIIVVMVVIFILLVLMVMCIALQKTSTNANSGFQQHLAYGGPSQPQSPIAAQYSPGASPSSQFSVNPRGGTGIPVTPSVSFMNPGANIATPQQSFSQANLPSTAYSRRTRSSSSPKQHGLFSQ